jgi:hypothetical protein
MKLQFLAIALLTTSVSASAIECSALKSYDNGTRYVTVTETLNPVDGMPGKVEAEVEEAYFTFSEKSDGEYSAKIIMAPDYVNGISTVANFDSDGNFRLSQNKSSTRFVLTCKK